MKLYAEGPAQVFKYLYSERGIAYFEGGWWMHDSDRLSFNGVPRPLRRNEETKQIMIDDTVFTIRPKPSKRSAHN